MLFGAGKNPVLNARLGVLFAWTGCISSTLWMCAALHFADSYKASDLAPLPVYTALTLAGLSLMFVRVNEPMEEQS
jgi:hypothetical protein